MYTESREVERSSRSSHEQPRGCLPSAACPSSFIVLSPSLQQAMSDRASKALAEPFLPGEPRTYDTRSKRSRVPLSTLHHRAQGRCSKEQKKQGRQYLTLSEEKALETFLKLISDLGNPVRLKFLP
jgi:hypothetical protein